MNGKGLSLISGIKFAAIDFDGVILNSEPYHYYVRERLIREYCGDVKYDRNECVGKSVKEFYRERLRQAGRRETDRMNAAVLAGKHFEQVYDCVVQGVLHVNEGLTQFVDQLRERGIITAVVSSSDSTYICRCLEHLNLYESFRYVFCGDQVRFAKPDPEIYRLALNTSRCKPWESMAVEDSLSGIRAANSAGIRCFQYVGESGNIREEPECFASVRTFSEIFTYMD